MYLQLILSIGLIVAGIILICIPTHRFDIFAEQQIPGFLNSPFAAVFHRELDAGIQLVIQTEVPLPLQGIVEQIEKKAEAEVIKQITQSEGPAQETDLGKGSL